MRLSLYDGHAVHTQLFHCILYKFTFVNFHIRYAVHHKLLNKLKFRKITIIKFSGILLAAGQRCCCWCLCCGPFLCLCLSVVTSTSTYCDSSYLLVSVCVCSFIKMCRSQISRKWREIETQFQWRTYRTWHIRNWMVMWSMTSRDLLWAGGITCTWRRLRSLTVFLVFLWLLDDAVFAVVCIVSLLF